MQKKGVLTKTSITFFHSTHDIEFFGKIVPNETTKTANHVSISRLVPILWPKNKEGATLGDFPLLKLIGKVLVGK